MAFPVSPGYLLAGAAQQRQLGSVLDFGVSGTTRLCRCVSGCVADIKRIQMYLGLIPSRLRRVTFHMDRVSLNNTS